MLLQGSGENHGVGFAQQHAAAGGVLEVLSPASQGAGERLGVVLRGEVVVARVNVHDARVASTGGGDGYGHLEGARLDCLFGACQLRHFLVGARALQHALAYARVTFEAGNLGERNLGVSPCGEEVLGNPDGAAHHRDNGGDGHQGCGGGVGDPAAVFDVAGEGEADAEQGHGATEQRADEEHPAVRLFVAHVAVENFVGTAVVAFTHLLFGAEAGDGAQTGGDVGGA